MFERTGECAYSANAFESGNYSGTGQLGQSSCQGIVEVVDFRSACVLAWIALAGIRPKVGQCLKGDIG
jgi:hypothetical protein